MGDYDHFQEVYAVKKAQLEAAYNAPAAGNQRAERLCGPKQGSSVHQKYGHVQTEEAGQDGCH